jgi:hypothetical protein
MKNCYFPALAICREESGTLKLRMMDGNMPIRRKSEWISPICGAKEGATQPRSLWLELERRMAGLARPDQYNSSVTYTQNVKQ